MRERYDLIVVGAGPSGLSAAIEAARHGMRVVVFDENSRPGGQLFKQIHKFFGSEAHKAKMRGIQIGRELLCEAEKLGVEVSLDTVVTGLFQGKEVSVVRDGHMEHFSGNAVIVATGAAENVIPFPGWTLPGVIGAGAAQTMMNLHGVLPGKRVLMVGSGNVGLVVSYQLLQAGCSVEALVDVLPSVGGYGVHASKVARTGVPFFLSHTVVKAEGCSRVTGAVIAEVDRQFRPIAGTERHLDVDTICMAVGLSPMSQLTRMAGCRMIDEGGLVPACDDYGETSITGIFAAGDVSGIEEASSAMITGRIAAAAAAWRYGFLGEREFRELYQNCGRSLSELRQGMFCKANKGKQTAVTEEGYPLSLSLLKKGYAEEDELRAFPAAQVREGVAPVIECTQNIPCNPCQDACPRGCIRVGEKITGIPVLVEEQTCSGCGMCVASCPGQAIFLVRREAGAETAEITLPYEFLPLPEKGERGQALDRSGAAVCRAEVISVRTAPAFDRTALLTIRVPAELAGRARFYKKGGVE